MDLFERATNNLVNRLKKKGKKKPEANTGSTLSQVLRNTKLKCSEEMSVLSFKEANLVPAVPEGPMVKCVLISEGLGNRRNMNYYGPEAIASAPPIFEGKPCFIDHPSESEERDIPERRVRDKVGYFKNVKQESVNGENCITGELHFDLSESGHFAYAKSCTALHYKDEFPSTEDEYVGLSINADGEWEQRTVQLGGESLDVNYVTRFTNAMSCDIVTSPARGGRFLALVESAAGVVYKSNKEVESMKNGSSESLKAARTAIKEADEEKDPKKKAVKVAESRKLFEQFLKEAASEAAESEDKSDKKEAGDMCAEDEAKDDEDKDKEKKEEAEEKSDKKEDESKEESKEDESESKEDDKDEDSDDDDDVVESKRVAIVAIAKESGVLLDEHKVKALCKLSLKEAKLEIASLKKMKEAIVRDTLKKYDVPVSNLEKLSESERKDLGSKNNGLFDNCFK